MTRKPRTSVVLTKEGRLSLNDKTVKLFMKDGTHFSCDSVNEIGFFLDMKIHSSQTAIPKEDIEFSFNLSIPVEYVRYMLTSDIDIPIGFSMEPD